jgi:hypothetical protein
MRRLIGIGAAIVVARDDDSGEGLNADIVHTCAMTGVCRLAVTAFSTSTTPAPAR